MRQRQFDLVVVGCGAGGLSAATAAAEKGASVAIIERAPESERGGQTRYTEAYLRMKSKQEVTDDFEEHMAANGGGYIDPDLVQETLRPLDERQPQARTLNMVDPEFLQTLAGQAGPTIAWLESFGLQFDFLPTQFLTKSQPRLLPVGGGLALVEKLAGQAEKLGVSFFYETTFCGLEVNEAGCVTSLVARDAAGRRERFFGKIVLACGGFEGNAEMLTRYIGPRSIYLRPICKGALFNRGEGIEMALAAGAATCGDFGSYHAEPIDPRSGVSEPSVFAFPYGVLVNKEGSRFTDEAPGAVDAHYENITRRIYEQTAGLAYVILDQKHTRIPKYRLSLRTDQPPLSASSMEDLATLIGVPAKPLMATIEAFNAACVDGVFKPLEVNGLATVGLSPAKSNWAVPLDEPPFHAYPIISANVFTFGGLKIDENAQVLNTDGRRIEGLYAAGEIVGSYYHTYTGATSVLKGLVFGRQAGLHAIKSRQAGALREVRA
ncbi:FAD-dependent oxidoreductase [Bosea sp. (in: a-proteobacteria)]|uniref:FAD-dependent oxidoreductase n=1 Tax=Bosea sp. (in: a-proteobacteria) TaxID=1871050 RepID=UPI002620416C|nr:FAD-dependent oxidoreductase [Bosea sp. (in: a-proteobacteria)]MCO5090938.1 FAD-dependent oxidoreductase [Bosea sp. (in: a-proteobacteria)]